MYAFCTCGVAQFSGAIGDELAGEPRLLGALQGGLLRSVAQRATTQCTTTSRRALTFRLAFDASVKQLLPAPTLTQRGSHHLFSERTARFRRLTLRGGRRRAKNLTSRYY